MECELSFEPIFVSLAILFRFKKLPSEFEMVKICRAIEKKTHRKIELGVRNERCKEQMEKKVREKYLNEPHAYAMELETVKMNFSPKFRGHIFFCYAQCLNVCGNNVKWFWSQIWIVTQKNNVNKFLASNLRKNFEPQEPNTEDPATVAMGITKNANKQKALKHLESERNFDSFSMIVNILGI